MSERAQRRQTDDERRAYSRGYQRAVARSWDRMRRIVEIAKRYRESRNAAFAPRCETCDRWKRGDGVNDSATCQWGSCRLDFEFDMDSRMWVDGGDRKVITESGFGCVSWIPRKAA